jgi:putative FmdB family regulatory protein
VPLYEYQCKKCGHRFERIQKFSDPPARKCAQCGGAVEQLLAAPAMQFKGSGWYVTDYARKSGSGAKSESEGAKSEPAAEKPEAKKEAKKKANDKP